MERGDKRQLRARFMQMARIKWLRVFLGLGVRRDDEEAHFSLWQQIIIMPSGLETAPLLFRLPLPSIPVRQSKMMTVPKCVNRFRF